MTHWNFAIERRTKSAAPKVKNRHSERNLGSVMGSKGISAADGFGGMGFAKRCRITHRFLNSKPPL